MYVSTGGTGGGVPADAVGVCLIACLFFSYFSQNYESERLKVLAVSGKVKMEFRTRNAQFFCSSISHSLTTLLLLHCFTDVGIYQHITGSSGRNNDALRHYVKGMVPHTVEFFCTQRAVYNLSHNCVHAHTHTLTRVYLAIKIRTFNRLLLFL